MIVASTYSDLKIELIGTGEQSGTWGNTTNTNLGTAIEQAIVGKADVTVSSTSVTLSLTNSNALQDARALYLNLSGTPGGAATLNVPAIEKNYIVKNGTNEEVTIKVSGQTGVAIPTGKTALVYNDGTDVVTAIDFIPAVQTGDAQIDNININGNSITSTNTDGNITLDPDGTGAIELSGPVSVSDNLVTRATLKDYAVEGSAIGNTGATRTIDMEVANFFSATLDQACTFTFSNPPASGDFGAFVLELTNGGAFAITYPASVDFPGGVAPTLTASGVDQLVFTTRDGGTTYFAFVAGLDIKSP